MSEIIAWQFFKTFFTTFFTKSESIFYFEKKINNQIIGSF